MPQSLSRVYIHIVFSTKYRYPFIDHSIRERLWEYLGGICRRMECTPIQIGGVSDHVHILCVLSRKIPQMKLVEEIKKNSSLWMKTIDPKYSNFYWQNGYAAFSVNPRGIERVIHYIKNQEQHHRKKAFERELIATLKKYNVEYDERYLWE